nr:3'(2'),5'-bisphosphate nucleotidase CysQ [Algicola sagamiensis]
MDRTTLLEGVQLAARQAGEAILKQYHSGDFTQSEKSDESPVTSADLAANQIVIEHLQRLTPDIPMISEESQHIALSDRENWPRYWLIDPLDGTQEFIYRSGDFAVNIALIEGHEPIFGLIYWPEKDIYYYGIKGEGAFKEANGQKEQIKVCASPSPQLRVAVSRRQEKSLVTQYISQEAQLEFIPLGSCSLKACLIAEGGADCYLRVGPTGEWDTGAAEVVVGEAGGFICDSEFNPLTYNQRESLSNPDFMVLGSKEISWKEMIQPHPAIPYK